MIGFIDKKELSISRANNCSRDKFCNDCMDIVLGDWKIFTQGYFLNINELKEQYGLINTEELLCKIIEEKGGEVVKELFGTYVIVAYNIKKQELLIINDLLSKRSVFFSAYGDTVYFSDSFIDLVNDLRARKQVLSIDSLGIKMLSRYQYFFDDVTYVNEIKFLKPFAYIKVDSKDIHVEMLPFPTERNGMDESAVLEDIDRIFTHADLLQFKKNEEYDYPQVSTLSGGWDSRMTFWYGYKNGYSNQICYCYSQANSIDEQIARSIATQCGCQFFHHMLNGGNYLLDRDMMTAANEGQMVYGDTGGIYDCMHMFNTSKWGIVHSGIGGGEVMGDLYRPNERKAWESFIQTLGCDEKESTRMNEIIKAYPSYNFFQNLNDIRHCLNAQKSAGPYCHYNSPYLYEEFWIYMMSLPFDIKKDRYLYRKWFNKGCNLQQNTTYHWGVRSASKFEHNIRRVWHKVLVKLNGVSKYDMKPYFYWEKTNPVLMEGLTKTYKEDIATLQDKVSKDIIELLDTDWNRFDLRMKMNVLTALWALKKIVC